MTRFNITINLHEEEVALLQAEACDTFLLASKDYPNLNNVLLWLEAKGILSWEREADYSSQEACQLTEVGKEVVAMIQGRK